MFLRVKACRLMDGPFAGAYMKGGNNLPSVLYKLYMNLKSIVICTLTTNTVEQLFLRGEVYAILKHSMAEVCQ